MQNAKFDKSWLLFLAAAAVFLAIKIPAADYAVSDENTYYKMGQLVASGQVPYRDFFFAHPPLQVYLYAVVFKLFGFNFLLLKMISAVAVVAAAAFVFAAMKDKLNAKIAAAAAALFLFSYGTLLFSNFPTGTEIATAFAAAGFYFFMRKNFTTSGVLLGFASVTALLSVIIMPLLLFIAVFIQKDRKSAIKLLAGFAAVFAIINGLFLIVAKGEYLKQVLIYHLNKPAVSADKAAVFFRIMKTNAFLFIAAAIALVSRNRTKAFLVMSAVVAAAYIAAFPLLKTAFNYYLLYAFPFLAVVAGYGILSLHEFLTEKAKLRKEAAFVAVALLLLLSGFAAVRGFVSYDFQDFPQAKDVSEYVKANSQPAQTIFGDDSTVPLVSLLSGREIALDYIDNNALRYSSGVTDLGQTLQLLQGGVNKGELKFVILRRIKAAKGTFDFGIATQRQFMGFVNESCGLAKEFPLEWRGLIQTYEVYDCLKTRD
ncbi:glycosyltransferase family 39 protein [Candidatus Woesearchaeota archaeon]|nr:glycosyltransferase family 39 protein [Candidatus Woesearchaeota archaeon]